MITPLAVLLTLATPDPAIIDLRAGVTAFSQGRYSESLRHLRRFEPDAVRLGEQALTWWHLGRALEELGRPCEALPWFVKAAKVPNAPTAKVKEKVARIQARTFAKVRVDCKTPGVAVRLKGIQGELACPGEWTELAPKRYTIIAQVGGRDFPAVQVDARRCQTARVDVEMAGSLRVDSPTAGAEVWLEGKRLGPAPQTVPAMPAGDYPIEVRAAGHVTSKRTVQVPPGGVFEHQAALLPIPEVDDKKTEDHSTPARTGAWINTVGAIGLLSAGGVILYQGVAAQDESDRLREMYNAETDPETIAELRRESISKKDEAGLKGAIGYSLLAGGVVLTGLATWLFLRDDDDDTALMLSPGGATWQVRW